MRLVGRCCRCLATLGVAVVLLAAWGSVAAAFDLRTPQIPLNSAILEAYLVSRGETIDADNDQVEGQVWTSDVSGNAAFTLMIELAGYASLNAIGVYNTGDPPNPTLFEIFPGAASAGWFAIAHFAGGNLTVTLFDNNAVIQGQIAYTGVNPDGFGFYLQGPGGTFYSQDHRNPGGSAQVLTFAGTGQNFGGWWECFEDLEYGEGLDFKDAVLLLQSVVPTPVNGATWGRVKSHYRR